MKIAVVEDDEITRRIMHRFLVQLQHEVAPYSSGEEARDNFDTFHPDIILLDANLPGMSGMDLCHWIRRSSKHVQTFVIFVTSRDKSSDLQELLDSGCDDYLAKPLNLDLLRVRLLIAEKQVRRIVERKQAQDALSLSEERFRRLVESTKVVPWEMDPDTLRYSYVGPQGTDLLIYPSADWLELGFIEKIILPEDRDATLSALRRQVELNKPDLALEYRLMAATGNTVWVRDVITLDKTAGGGEILRGFILDITDRKKAEEERIRASKLESIGVLAGGLAHDLNNILLIIGGNIMLAKEAGENGQSFAALLGEAQKAVDRAAKLSQQLLTFAKGGDPIKKPTLLQTLVEEPLTAHLRNSSITAVHEIDPQLWPCVVDENQIAQVFSSIVSNAREAMPGEGTLYIRASNVHLDADPAKGIDAGKYVKLVFRDSGTGFDEAIKQKIFDPYFTTKPHAAGLGLTTAYSIVKRHRGIICADSEKGRWAEFCVLLPADPLATPATTLVGGDHTAFKPGTGRVLVMDDEKSIRSLLMRMLVELGYDVEVAADGDEALHIYTTAKDRGKSFDVVILDLTLANGPSGEEVMASLLKIEPQVKGIAFSGYSNSPVIANYKDYGFQASLRKPFQLTELSRCIAGLISHPL